MGGAGGALQGAVLAVMCALLLASARRASVSEILAMEAVGERIGSLPRAPDAAAGSPEGGVDIVRTIQARGRGAISP